jgi:hypothetical protein
MWEFCAIEEAGIASEVPGENEVKIMLIKAKDKNIILKFIVISYLLLKVS